MMGEDDLEANREQTLARLAELKKAKKDMAEEYEFAKQGDVERVRFRLKEIRKREGQWVVNRRSPATGRSLLHEAATYGHKFMVEMLVEEFRVDVERATEMGWDTALHLAAANGHRQVCFYLLTRYNANPNPQNRYKMTPLHYCRDVATVKCLARYGGDCTMTNFQGMTPVQMVMDEGGSEVLIDTFLQISEEHERKKFHEDIENQKRVQEEIDAIKRKELENYHKRQSDFLLKQAEESYFMWRRGEPFGPEKKNKEDEEPEGTVHLAKPGETRYFGADGNEPPRENSVESVVNVAEEKEVPPDQTPETLMSQLGR